MRGSGKIEECVESSWYDDNEKQNSAEVIQPETVQSDGKKIPLEEDSIYEENLPFMH